MQLEQKSLRWFRKELIQWYESHERPMPWKEIKDPYLIWLSEIILQQTRVEQGWDYFLKFKKVFPNVHALARASEKEVLKQWEGLGYYSRARNLHASAKFISEQGGNFQADYKWLLSLKGVGPYTAAAIASFAFQLPYAVVDGNVYRVLSRYFAQHIPIDSTPGKKLFQSIADQLLDSKIPGKYNQAIMDFGATVCLPSSPNCEHCPLATNCQALEQKTVSQFPVKEKKLKKKTRYFYYLDIRFQGQRLFNSRNGKDIWKGLYDFPLIERTSVVEINTLKKSEEWHFWNTQYLFEDEVFLSNPYKQQLTHQTIYGQFLRLNATSRPVKLPQGLSWIEEEKVQELPFPKIISFYLADKHLSLNLQ